MDYKFLNNTTIYIFLNPAKAWETIHSENRPIKDINGSFSFPLIIIVSVAAFLGSMIFTNSELPFVYSVLVAIKYFVLLYSVIYSSAYILKEITFAMDMGRDFNTSFKIITYSVAPLLICLIISRLFESLIFIDILSLYGLYIFRTGSEKMLNTPEYKKIPLMVSAFITTTGLFIAYNFCLTKIVDWVYFTFFS